jgi:chromosome segregation ATPase
MANTATATLSAEQINQQLQVLWNERTGLENKLRAISQDRAAIEDKRRGLKKRHAGGDKTAALGLNQLDEQDVDLLRTEEGLRLSLDELEPKILDLQKEANTLARMRAEEQRQNQLQAATEQARALVERFFTLYGELSKTVAEIRITYQALSDQFGVEGLRVGERYLSDPLVNPLHQLVNIKGWTKPQVLLFDREFTVRGLLPPASNGKHN